MTEMLTALTLAGLVLIGGLVLIRRRNQRTWQQELVAYVLKFPRGIDPAAVVSFIGALSGLVAPRLERPFAVRAVVLEVSARPDGITHHLLVPKSLAHIVLSALRATLPSVSAQIDGQHQTMQPALSAELALNDHGRSLATDRAATVATAVLASLQPLEPGEQVLTQWTLMPVGPVSHSSAGRTGFQSVIDALAGTGGHRPVDAETLKALRIKQQAPLFAATCRIGVRAGHLRSRSLLSRVIASFHAANAPGAHLRRKHHLVTDLGRAITEHRLPLASWPCSLNAGELAGLVAFPMGTVTLPGLQLGGARQLAPASDIPSRGRVIAQATFPGAERPLALSMADSFRHLHVIGPTGVGKSTMLLGLIAQDMAAGHGVVVIEPSGDLVSDVLDRVPPHRLSDVVVLDPADEERPVGLNILSTGQTAPDLVVEQVLGIFHQLYKASWGPRTDDILRAALLTLVDVPGMTLCEVPLLLTDDGFRRQLIGRIDDPVGLGPFWGWYEGLSTNERTQAIGPVLNKMRAFLMRRRLRNVLGQATPAFDLDQALADRRIILVPLVKGTLGEEAAQLLGSLLVARLWQAVQRRVELAPDERPPTFGYIDEFQNYVNLPTSVADILAEARKLKLGLTLAHQHLGQLSTPLKEAVLANARSRVIFQLAAGDAKTLAQEIAPHLEAHDLRGLGAYEVAVMLSTGTRVAPPATGVTLPPPRPTGFSQTARERSRLRYGADRAEIEAAIRARHDGRVGPGGVGRKERRS
ncbi:conjugal transfer protein TraG [Rhizocola hellebori]|uniref:Conjugal transfer protein TraG n=1 Tax=Rhizocola hellebori TaxID=1392758 RepID=A0A8J3VHU6_9ACTN|nr:type IV secretion system DNA-binding domain-containing protein [Rhizocola hellebori]GIH06642.1 conjugal transfer protein TraG [Rhizocola hellebori]